MATVQPTLNHPVCHWLPGTFTEPTLPATATCKVDHSLNDDLLIETADQPTLPDWVAQNTLERIDSNSVFLVL
jgi:hypothetical protein